MYAKLENGQIKFANNVLKINGQNIFTTDPRPYGYKKVVYTPQPTEEGKIAVPDGWEETDTEIRQKWKLIDRPAPTIGVNDRIKNVENGMDALLGIEIEVEPTDPTEEEAVQ